jgi:hypothetical protein
MAFKLLDMAQKRWRRLDGTALLPMVRARVKFIDGVQKSGRKPHQPNDAAPREAMCGDPQHLTITRIQR